MKPFTHENTAGRAGSGGERIAVGDRGVPVFGGRWQHAANHVKGFTRKGGSSGVSPAQRAVKTLGLAVTGQV